MEVKQKLAAIPADQRLMIIKYMEALPLRRDLLTFLNYLAENNVTGTQSTGNLPLKHVRALSEKFVNPPELDTFIGEIVYKLKSESEIRPIFFVHSLAEYGSLVNGGPGVIWQVTTAGKKFLIQEADRQVLFLLYTWLYRMDWRISGFNEPLFGELNSVLVGNLLEYILQQPGDISQPFKLFADGLIAKTGMVWEIENQIRSREHLHFLIGDVVVEPLISLGVFECEYVTREGSESDYPVLQSIKLTSQGKILLSVL